MSRRKKRLTSDYIASAKRLAKFAPSLKRYGHRLTLTRYEKSAIARKEKILRKVDQLIPVTKKQARLLKGDLYAPGIRAIQLRNTSAHAKIKVKEDLIVTSNDRTWVYWKIDKETARTKKDLAAVAKEAFEAKLFPIEKVSKLAEIAFKKLKPISVALWTKYGRADAEFTDFKVFMRELDDKWQAGRYVEEAGRYVDDYTSDPGSWLKGIAILVHEK